MIIDFPFLSSLIIIPVIGALFILFFTGEKSKFAVNNMFTMAFWISLINFLVSLVVLYKFDAEFSGFQFVESSSWITKYDIGYRLGLDGISLLLVILTTAFFPLCILYSKKVIDKKIKQYLISFLFLESFIIGVFLSTDLLLFYFFFELTLIPMFIIIGVWGGKDRIYASYKFFLYTFAGSILFLLAIIVIINAAQTTDLVKLYELLPTLFSFNLEKYLWLALFVAFAVKIPMFPFHTWLPDAHVQAPTSGSIILAAILLKMGAYGFIRFSLPLFPTASMYFRDLIFYLSAIAIIYTSIIAFYQTDIKKLIAYSSIAHMGYVTLGIFSFNELAMQGAIFQMISHGIISGALFLCVGVIYEQLKTREIAKIGGVATIMPKFSFLFLVLTFGSIALPATSGFVGEFLVLVGVYKTSPTFMILASFGVILGAIYMLWLVKRIIMGEPLNEAIKSLQDVSRTEYYILGFLSASVIILGIYPALILDIIDVSVKGSIAIFK
jgi:NADH-quinone oxidoreductase subunit M